MRNGPFRIALAVLMVFMALGITGCGKKARHLDPPDNDGPHYPRQYPPKDSPGASL